jgi:hypothetical protein
MFELQRCWTTDPKDRISATDLAIELQKLPRKACLTTVPQVAARGGPTTMSTAAVPVSAQTPGPAPMEALQSAFDLDLPIHAHAPIPAPLIKTASSEDVEEELRELVPEMVKLKLGMMKACVTFARSLALAGIMSLEDLRPYPPAKARGFLEKAGMQEVQIDKVVAAYNSPPVLVALVPAPAPAPAPALQPTAQQKVAAPPNAARPTRCRLRDAHSCRLLLLLLALQANPTLLKQQKAATLLW